MEKCLITNDCKIRFSCTDYTALSNYILGRYGVDLDRVGIETSIYPYPVSLLDENGTPIKVIGEVVECYKTNAL